MQNSAWGRAQVRWEHHSIRPTCVYSCLNSNGVCNSDFPLLSSAEPEKWKDTGINGGMEGNNESLPIIIKKLEFSISIFSQCLFCCSTCVALDFRSDVLGRPIYIQQLIFIFSLPSNGLTPFLYLFGFFFSLFSSCLFGI